MNQIIAQAHHEFRSANIVKDCRCIVILARADLPHRDRRAPGAVEMAGINGAGAQAGESGVLTADLLVEQPDSIGDREPEVPGALDVGREDGEGFGPVGSDLGDADISPFRKQVDLQHARARVAATAVDVVALRIRNIKEVVLRILIGQPDRVSLRVGRGDDVGVLALRRVSTVSLANKTGVEPVQAQPARLFGQMHCAKFVVAVPFVECPQRAISGMLDQRHVAGYGAYVRESLSNHRIDSR